jgi:hypothetical protein
MRVVTWCGRKSEMKEDEDITRGRGREREKENNGYYDNMMTQERAQDIYIVRKTIVH